MCCGLFVDIFSEEGVVAGFMTSTRDLFTFQWLWGVS